MNLRLDYLQCISNFNFFNILSPTYLNGYDNNYSQSFGALFVLTVDFTWLVIIGLSNYCPASGHPE